jgi:hypothetical protein
VVHTGSRSPSKLEQVEQLRRLGLTIAMSLFEWPQPAITAATLGRLR